MSEPHRPAGFAVAEVGGVLRITRRWFWLPTVLLFCALAPYFLWLGATRSTALPTLLGIVFVYGLALFLLNRTVIEVTDERLTIRHGPLPSLLPRREIDPRELERLFLEEDAFYPGGGDADVEYELMARTRDGGTVVLLSSLPDREQARFLARLLAERLGIADPSAPERPPER